MKHYYNTNTNSFFTIINFEYIPKNTDIEISEEAWNEYELKRKQGYNISIATANNQVVFSYTLDEARLLKAKQNKLRNKRKPLLEAFDLWEKAVLRGREADSAEVMTWYQALLDLEESAFDTIPSAVQYYL